MNNEPVAWINVEKRRLEWAKTTLWETPTIVKLDRIPLYTHPVKELDRELLDKTIIDQQNEIKDLRKNLDVALMIVNKPELTDEEINWLAKAYSTMEGELNAPAFAKAILRKAQENGNV